jgi:hypothetical protein
VVLGALFLLLAACGHPGATVAAVAGERTGIDLRVTFVTPVDTRTRVACEAGVVAVLLHHGFVVDPAGTPIAVEVILVYDPAANVPAGTMGPDQLPEYGNVPIRSPGDAGSTAELTARIGLAGAPRTIRTAGAAQGLACNAAAERLAAGLAGVLRRR